MKEARAYTLEQGGRHKVKRGIIPSKNSQVGAIFRKEKGKETSAPDTD